MLAPDPMLGVAANARRYWWLFLVRGLFGLALGVYAIALPGAALAAVILLIGAYLVIDGVITCAKAVQIVRSDKHWWIVLLEGILGIAVGLAIFVFPGLSIITLAYLVGYWAIFSGITSIVGALRLRAHISNEWLYLLFGVISVVFGFVVLMAPATGLVYIVLAIAIYGFVMGVTMIALAFRARSLPV